MKWDLIIAHPPCTYLTGASAVELSKHPERLQKGFESVTFFTTILNADCKKICVENPPPMKRFNLPEYNQLIRAYKIGEPHTKAYCLWLKGLPMLKVDETTQKPKAEYQWIHSATGKKKSGSKWYNTGNSNHRKHRSKTPEGLAKAMAEQWGGNVTDNPELLKTSLKPEYRDGDPDAPICPNCRTPLNEMEDCNCGQKIDWSEE